MKTNSITLAMVILFLVSPVLSFSQWYPCYNGAGYLNQVFTLDMSNAYVVGTNGLLLKTANGCVTWEQISTGTTQQLFDVVFVNPSVGFMCGANGTFLKSTDGGNTWTSCPTSTALHLHSLSFINDSTGWVAGSSTTSVISPHADAGIILHTTNGGGSFTVSKNLTSGVTKISGVNKDTCFAACMGYTSSYLMRTFDRGINWQIIPHSVYFGPTMETFPGGTIYDASTQYLYTSADFGNTWDSTFMAPVLMVDEISFPTVGLGFTAGYDPLAGWGAVYLTSDGGQNWNSAGPTGNFISIDVIVDITNDTVGYAVNNDGSILKYGLGVGIPSHGSAGIPSVRIYPNPATTIVTIETDKKTKGKLQIELSDILGNKIKSAETDKLKYNLNVEGLKEGVYFISVRDQRGFSGNYKILKITP